MAVPKRPILNSVNRYLYNTLASRHNELFGKLVTSCNVILNKSKSETNIANFALEKFFCFMRKQKTIAIISINLRKSCLLKVQQRKDFLTIGQFGM